MKLAHISDLHLKDFTWAPIFLDRIFEENIDHLLVSGDIMEGHDPSVLLAFADYLDHKGFMDVTKTTIVPGNHDIHYGSEGFVSGLRSAVEMTFVLNKKATNTNTFLRTFAPVIDCFKTGQFPYPHVKSVGRSNPLTIVSLDTVSRQGLLKSAQGNFLERDEADDLLAYLEHYPDTTKILVMHHPPVPVEGNYTFAGNIAKWMPLGFKELDPVLAFIKEARFTAVFCGHIHMMDDDVQSSQFTESVEFGDPAHRWLTMMYCMGRSGGMHQEGTPVHAFHIITHTSKGLTVKTRYWRRP